MRPSPNEPSPLQLIQDAAWERRGVRLLLKRDDLVHPFIRGNKWRKLKYNLIEILREPNQLVLTFGGAFSNHLHAVAVAGRVYGFKTVGVVRGEPHTPLNEVLSQATDAGMELRYMDRETYRHKGEEAVLRSLRREVGDFYLLPEGGSNCLALRGAGELAAEIPADVSWLGVPCGTGGTLAGIVSRLSPNTQAVGFSSLKGGEFLADDVARMLRECHLTASAPWSIETAYHFGGFGRSTPELVQFGRDFEFRHCVELDLVYGAKMMFGLFELLDKGRFASGESVVAVITGGLRPSELNQL